MKTKKTLPGIEKELSEKIGLPFIAIDEAGRGPLAGPLSVSGVLVDDFSKLLLIGGIADSKKLSAVKRTEIFEISKKYFTFKNILVPSDVIDAKGLTFALNLASNRIVDFFLKSEPKFILLDGKHDYIKHKSVPTITEIKGDASNLSLGLASINAKVTRDSVMEEYDAKYPAYGFKHNKGYGTQEHRNAILKSGITPIHRQTFLKGLA